MLKVNSKDTIKKLAKSSFRANKMRNIFAIISILLTSILFTTLFTVTASLIDSMEESTMRQVGGNAHGGFKYLSKEQYDKLKKHPDIKDISYSVVLGVRENTQLVKQPTEIRYTSGVDNAKGMFSFPTTGRLPKENNELATNTLVLKKLGIPAVLGQKVTLEYSIGGEKIRETFKLVGYWEGDKIMQASMAWVNKDYVEEKLAYYKSNIKDPNVGMINADVNFNNSNNIENKLIKVITESGYTLDEIAYGVNWAYTGNNGSINTGTLVAVGAGILMIVLSGYLMIANVFNISVSRDVRYYGLIKTIGTTPRQIRKLLRNQAIWLSLVGIPIGLLFGYLIATLLVPKILYTLNTEVISISINPFIFVFSGLFTLVTVFISLIKPSIIAAKVSPIEALRAIDSSEGDKRKFKKEKKQVYFPWHFLILCETKRKSF